MVFFPANIQSERPSTRKPFRPEQNSTREKPPGTTKKDEDNENEVYLDVEQILRAHAVSTSALVSKVMDKMEKPLFSKDVVVYGESGAEEKRLTEFARDYMTPYIKDAFLAEHIFGVCPCVFRKLSADEREFNQGIGIENDIVPSVPPFGTYIISTYTEKSTQHFRLYTEVNLFERDLSKAKICHNSMILSTLGRSPNINGTLRSRFHTVAPYVLMMSQKNELALRADSLNAMPYMISGKDPQFKEPAVPELTSEGAAIASVTTDGETNTVIESYLRNGRETAELGRQLSNQAYGGNMVNYQEQHIKFPQTVPVSRTELDVFDSISPTVRTIELPHEHKVVFYPRAHGPDNLTADEIHVANLVESTLFINPNATAAGHVSAIDTQLGRERQMQVIHSWADQLARIMDIMYIIMHDYSFESRSSTDNVKKTPAPAINFTLDIPIQVSPEELREGYAAGILTFANYAKMMGNALGIPEIFINTIPPRDPDHPVSDSDSSDSESIERPRRKTTKRKRKDTRKTKRRRK